MSKPSPSPAWVTPESKDAKAQAKLAVFSQANLESKTTEAAAMEEEVEVLLDMPRLIERDRATRPVKRPNQAYPRSESMMQQWRRKRARPNGFGIAPGYFRGGVVYHQTE